MKSEKLYPTAFFDRDGVLNVDTDYAHRPDQIDWIEGAFEAVSRLNRAGYRVFIVTNQSGIARGLFDEADVRALMAWMVEEFGRNGARIDDWRFCPYHPDHQAARYAAFETWRKPEPGMLLDLMAQWPVDRARSLIIGDRLSDIEAGRRAGIAGHLFEGGDLDAFVSGLIDAGNR